MNERTIFLQPWDISRAIKEKEVDLKRPFYLNFAYPIDVRLISKQDSVDKFITSSEAIEVNEKLAKMAPNCYLLSIKNPFNPWKPDDTRSLFLLSLRLMEFDDTREWYLAQGFIALGLMLPISLDIQKVNPPPHMKAEEVREIVRNMKNSFDYALDEIHDKKREFYMFRSTRNWI